MSHFTAMKVNFRTASEAELVAALEAQFGVGSVEVHEKGSALIGFQGDNRASLGLKSPDYAPPCHIVIRRKNVGPLSNDIGYRRLEDGSYAAYVSEYDKEKNFSIKKRNAVAQDYSTRVAEKKLKSQGYTLKRSIEKDGTIKLIATRYG